MYSVIQENLNQKLFRKVNDFLVKKKFKVSSNNIQFHSSPNKLFSNFTSLYKLAIINRFVIKLYVHIIIVIYLQSN